MDGQLSGRVRGLLLLSMWEVGAIATSTPPSLESDDISFVLGVGTTVADSVGEGMVEAANVEVEWAVSTLVDDEDKAVG